MSPAQRNKMDMNERKYFDSGDYELTRAGKETSTAIGSEHPSPESIPHSNPVSHPPCPVKESPLAETNME
ncbi:hypothetical protein G6F37_006651 [Rhizopus arrhizus]|nr:hypothetical protein G6F38_004718 [Rhizopus arrhizus]KAG1157497.1 hypothetical protein G6F37_006651 [Rhizopus arrhizus]